MYDIDPANLDRCRDQYRLNELENENTRLRTLLKQVARETLPQVPTRTAQDIHELVKAYL